MTATRRRPRAGGVGQPVPARVSPERPYREPKPGTVPFPYMGNDVLDTALAEVDNPPHGADAHPSYLAELGEAVRAGCLVVLSVYLDESDQWGVQVFAVGGYAFTPKRAKRFETLWKRALRSADPPLSEFRMSKCAHRRGEFSNWSDEYRDAFLAKLAVIIRATASFYVGAAVDLKAYDALSADEKRTLHHGTRYAATPYALGVSAVMASVANATEPSERIAYFLDAAVSGQGKTRIMTDWDYLRKRPAIAAELRLAFSSISWVPSHEVPEIQAADFFVYKTAKEFARQVGRSTRPVRRSGKLLAGRPGGPPGHFSHFDTLRLYELIERVCADPEGLPT